MINTALNANIIICPGFSGFGKLCDTAMFLSIFEFKNKLSDDTYYIDSLLCYSHYENCFIYSFNTKQEFYSQTVSKALSYYLCYLDDRLGLKHHQMSIQGPKICLYRDRDNQELNVFQKGSIKQPCPFLTMEGFKNVFYTIIHAHDDNEQEIKLALIKWFKNKYIDNQTV